MAKNEPLFELIKSMTQTEKRYFKRFSTLQKVTDSANYVKLFVAVDGQKKYNEVKLIEKTKTMYFAQQKRHLYLKIMESLRSYHSGKTTDLEINSLLNDYHILINRSLMSQASKALARAKQLAVDNECFSDIIKIKKLESEFLWTENNIPALDIHIKEYKKTTQDVVKIIENQILFEKEYLHIVKWNKRIEFIRNENELKELLQIIQQPIFDNENNALSVVAKVQFFYIKGLYHFFLSEFKESESCFSRQLIYLENNPSIIKDEPLLYVRAISNYTLLNLKVNDLKKYTAGISKLSVIKGKNIQVQNYTDYLIYLLNLMYLNQTGDFKKAVQHIEKNKEDIHIIEEWIDQQKIMHIEKNYVFFGSIIAYMNVRDFKKAVGIMNKYLNNAEADFKEDSYCIAIILNLFIHFELHNNDLLEYQLKSVYRYLKTRERLYEFEKVIMRFIQNALETTNTKELQKEFVKLRDHLLLLKNKTFEKNVFEYFDFISWIDGIALK